MQTAKNISKGFVFIILFLLGVGFYGKFFSGEKSVAEQRRSNYELIKESMPNEQKDFLREVIEAQQLSSAAANDMQRGGIKHKRDTKICQILKTLKIKDWIGQVDTISANSDGKGVISILLGDKIWVKTWNNEFSDMYDATLVAPESKLFVEASNLREGQLVTFSGTFIRSDLDKECVRESSLSLSGKIGEPEFIFRFSSVSLLAGELVK